VSWKRLIALPAVFALASCGVGSFDPGVPVYRVERETFTRTVSADGNLRSVRSTPIVVSGLAQGPLKIGWLASDGAHVKKGDVVVQFDPTEMEKSLLDGRADRDTAESKILKREVEAVAAVKGSERDAKVARLELDVAQTFQPKDPEIFSRVAIIESEIDQKLAQHRLTHAQGSRESKETLARTDVELLTIERRKAELKMRRARQGLAALEVEAPHDGLVIFRRDNQGNVPKEGDLVWSRQPLADIPDLSEMEAEVFVLEADAGGLAADAPARVVLDSRPDVPYAARVKRVDNLPKPRLRGLPVQYFAVVLALERTDPAAMKPGQRVRATLTVDEKAAVLAIPRQAVFQRDDRSIAYRRSGGRFEPVDVTLGAFSLGRVVIESGLSVGDEIALRDPSQSLEDILRKETGATEKTPGGPKGP